MLSQNKISLKISFDRLQTFNFRSTVYSKHYTPTVIVHSYVLRKSPFCNDKGLIGLSLGCSTKSSRQSVLSLKSEMLKL